MGAGGRLVALDGGWAATDSEPRGQVSSLEAGRGRRATVRCKLSWVLAGRARWLDTLSEGTCAGPGPGGRQARKAPILWGVGPLLAEPARPAAQRCMVPPSFFSGSPGLRGAGAEVWQMKGGRCWDQRRPSRGRRSEQTGQ